MHVARLFNATNWKFAINEDFLIVAGGTIALAATLSLSMRYSLLVESRWQKR